MVADVAIHPGLSVPMHRIGHHNKKQFIVELGHGQIGFKRATLVEPWRVGDSP
jgi:hypothetical protein